MNKSLALLAITLLSSSAFAENIEKLVRGKPIVQDWVETETISCSKWKPSPSLYAIGTTFQQKSTCLVKEERFTQEVMMGAISHEIKEKSEKVSEVITVKKTKTQDAVGTFDPAYELKVGTYYKEGKRYFGYINKDVRRSYKIKDEDDESNENEGSLSKTDYKGYEIAALFQNDTNLILVYDKKAPDNILPTLKVNNTVCNSTEQYLNNGEWDIFYFKDCVDLSADEKSTIHVKID